MSEQTLEICWWLNLHAYIHNEWLSALFHRVQKFYTIVRKTSKHHCVMSIYVVFHAGLTVVIIVVLVLSVTHFWWLVCIRYGAFRPINVCFSSHNSVNASESVCIYFGVYTLAHISWYSLSCVPAVISLCSTVSRSKLSSSRCSSTIWQLEKCLFCK